MKRILLLLFALVALQTAFAQSFDGFLHLDAPGDYADNQANYHVLPDSSDFTLELRFRKCADSPSSFNLFDYRSSTAGSGIEAFYSDFLGAVQIIIQGESGWENAAYINAPLPLTTLNDGNWKHLAITYNDADDIAKVYIDGDLAAESDSVTFSPTAGHLVLGASDIGYLWPFPGEMDEFRTSNIIRYSTDFNVASTPFVSDANTLSLWHFDEVEGTNVFADEINALTLVGSETTSTIQVIENNAIDICAGTEIVLNGHDGFESYAWSPATGLSSSSIADPVTTPNASSSYTLTASQGNCTYSDDVLITIGDLNAQVSGNLAICAGDSTQISICCGTNYTWSPNTGISDPSGDEVFLFPSVTTTYVVDVFESANCTDQDTITIVVNSLPVADIIASTDTICMNELGQATLTAADGTAASYQWFPFDAVGCSNCPSTPALVTSTTTVTLVVTSEFGCISSDDQLLTVLDCLGIEDLDDDKIWSAFPNPFSEVIQFAGLTRDDVLLVYDASGRLVISSSGSDPLQTSHLETGSYVLTLISKGSISHRVMQKI